MIASWERTTPLLVPVVPELEPNERRVDPEILGFGRSLVTSSRW